MKLNIKNLKELRKKEKIPQREIADALGFKTPGGYQRIEIGENNLKVEHLPILAQKFNMSINDLVKVIFFGCDVDETSTFEDQLG